MKRKVSVVMVSLLMFLVIFYPRSVISESQGDLSFELSKELTEVQVINSEEINLNNDENMNNQELLLLK